MIKLITIVVGLVGLVACQQDGGYDIGPPSAPVVPQPVSAYTGAGRPYNFNNRNVNNLRGPNYYQQQRQPTAADLRYQGIQNLRSENVNNGDGTFNYFYENDDGSSASQRGYLKGPRTADEESIQVQEGFYQYYSPEGQLIRVDYIADENGFQPRGDHLPTPPPIPEAIQKSLDLIYAGIEKQRLNPTTPRPYYQQQQQYKNQDPYNRYRPVAGAYKNPSGGYWNSSVGIQMNFLSTV